MEEKTSQNLIFCQLCGRSKELAEHHLIPRTLHSNKWFKKNFRKQDMRERKILICHDCHSFLHKQYTPKELGRTLNTLENLLKTPAIQKFAGWVKKQA